MSLSVTLRSDGTSDSFQLASATGWQRFCEWAEKTGAPALREFCNVGYVRGTDALAAQLYAALSDTPAPEPVRHTASDLLTLLGVGDPDETAEVES